MDFSQGPEKLQVMPAKEERDIQCRCIASCLFWLVFILGETAGIAAIILAGVWMSRYGHFEWTEKDVFNFHPVFMSVAMIFLYGQAIVLYRVLRFLPKRVLKLSHAMIHLWIIVLASIGLAAAFDSHNYKKIPNLYSLHSWLGVAVVATYIAQFLGGVTVYLLPYAPISIRVASMPFHRVLGMIIFAAAGATALMGTTEKAIFSSKDCWVNRTCSDADVINWFGLSIFMYVVCIIFVVATPDYRRQPLPSD